MQFLFSFALAGWLAIASPWAMIAPAMSSLATLPGLNGVFAGSPPETLGAPDGRFAPCPPSPNCVVSQGADPDHIIEPIRYQSDLDTAREALLKELTVVPGTKGVAQTDTYIRTESESKLMGFIDDGEFYFPADQPVIEVRSAARLGESDIGVNRRRIEQIRLALADLGV